MKYNLETDNIHNGVLDRPIRVRRVKFWNSVIVIHPVGVSTWYIQYLRILDGMGNET